jgi:PAS domain S-box-containing protein
MNTNKKLIELRHKAEQVLKSTKPDASNQDIQQDVMRLVEELSVYQIELELQNQELQEKMELLNLEKNRFADLSYNAPIGYLVFDSKGIITEVNHKASQFLNTPEQQLKGAPFISYLRQKDVDVFFMHLAAVFNAKSTGEIKAEINIVSTDNQVRTLRLTSNMFQGSFCRTIAEDITDRRKQRIQMEQLNQRLHNSMIAGNMAWWELELPSGDIQFNENKAKMLGRNPRNFTHYTHFVDLLHPDDYENTMAAFRDHIAGLVPLYECEYRIQHADGHYLWFYDIGRISQKHESIITVNGIVSDITARKKAEYALQCSEQKYRTLFESNIDGIAVCGLDTNQKPTKFFDFNDNAARIVGLSREEFAVKTPADIEVYDPNHLDTSRQKELNRKGFIQYETALQHKLGHFVYAEIFAKYVQYENKPAMMFITHDISQQKENEQIIASQNESLRKANETKDLFFNIIAHDLRNPFHSILGITELLVSTNSEISEAERSEYLTHLFESAKGTYSLLEQLLEWARSQQNLIPFTPIALNICAELNSVIELLQPQATPKKIQIVRTVNQTTPILADQAMLRTVLRNILSNAIKYTPVQGTVTCSFTATDTENTIIISDSGIGMDSDTRSGLFTLGYHKSRKGTAGEQGTGFGLLICKDFMERHGGTIRVESTLNGGSTFYISLPG